jgi:hypothetical protein
MPYTIGSRAVVTAIEYAELPQSYNFLFLRWQTFTFYRYSCIIILSVTGLKRHYQVSDKISDAKLCELESAARFHVYADAFTAERRL